jgi:hypothetical protein
MTRAQSERRSAPRASVDLPLQIAGKGGPRPARLANISQSGLCCHYDEVVPEMTVMDVDLVLPDDEPRRVRGVVVRCEKESDRRVGGYEVAIYFTDLEAATRKAIRSYVLGRIAQA